MPAEGDLRDSLLETGWLLIAILVPLVVNLRGRQPFKLTKTALLRTLVWLLAGLWLSDYLLTQSTVAWMYRVR